jgi:hypothetical protein
MQSEPRMYVALRLLLLTPQALGEWKLLGSVVDVGRWRVIASLKISSDSLLDANTWTIFGKISTLL